ncbi:helix-turn-helix domain-containing protein [Streptomyces sp. CA-142005]|uniref:helix-turn-helix domain-containing protein n=1 Tax=Streptomyces sp. CA-142005 TaxID=3240052 RepID=UPI003D93B928
MPQVAGLVECHPVTVRNAVHRFTGGGFDALADAPRPGWPAQVTDDDLATLGALLDASAESGVTWTARELCDWLEQERGVRVSAAWLTELLHREGFRWKRTRESLRHKADPDLRVIAQPGVQRLSVHARKHVDRE